MGSRKGPRPDRAMSHVSWLGLMGSRSQKTCPKCKKLEREPVRSMECSQRRRAKTRRRRDQGHVWRERTRKERASHETRVGQDLRRKTPRHEDQAAERLPRDRARRLSTGASARPIRDSTVARLLRRPVWRNRPCMRRALNFAKSRDATVYPSLDFYINADRQLP